MSKQLRAEKDYFIVNGGEVREGDRKWSETKKKWLEVKDFDIGCQVSDYVCISRPKNSLESKKPVGWYKSGVSSAFSQEF